jgi:hypothetical protein
MRWDTCMSSCLLPDFPQGTGVSFNFHHYFMNTEWFKTNSKYIYVYIFVATYIKIYKYLYKGIYIKYIYIAAIVIAMYIFSFKSQPALD